MSKRHLENLAEQMARKGYASAPFHNERKSNQAIEPVESEDSAIKLRAYQIHLEKGGSDLDNWLEAEQSLRSSNKAISNYIDEGNPSSQK